MYSRLFTILLFFFGIHLFLYYSTVRFFIVTDSHLKNALFIITSFLSVSFMISAILARVHINPLTRAFYAVSAFWSGLVIYLLIAAVIEWLIAMVCWIAGRTPPMRLIGSLRQRIFPLNPSTVRDGLYPRFSPSPFQVSRQRKTPCSLISSRMSLKNV